MALRAERKAADLDEMDVSGTFQDEILWKESFMAQEVYLTRAGYEKLIKELEFLKTTERRRISKAIGEARLQGDISENAEYDAAKEAQGHCEAKIAELEGCCSVLILGYGREGKSVHRFFGRFFQRIHRFV